MKLATATLDRHLESGWWAKRQQQMLTKVLAPLANATRGTLSLNLPNGSQIEFGEHPCERLNPVVKLHNWQAVGKAFTGGSLGWSEAYIDGDWDSPNLAILIEWIVVNESSFDGMLEGSKFASLVQKWRHRRNGNSKRGSRRNIRYHYDLGNNFYQHWLDPGMTYSAAYFESEQQSLCQAQSAKYQRLIDLSKISDGDRVLEIGCGWGGFAEQLCQQKAVQLDGITLSERQLEFAEQRLSTQQLRGHAAFSLTDYRDTKGQYDCIVSIEMLEAVGEKYWPRYFQTLNQRLKPGGRAAIQIITIAEDRFANYSAKPDFIQTYIFPGGMLPSPTRFRAEATAAGLSIEHEETFGLSYARTLREWAANFHQCWPEIALLGFDQRFKRMWDYYLGYCEGGFRGQSIDVCQFILAKPHN